MMGEQMGGTVSLGVEQPRVRSPKALVFAWLVEGLAVLMGLVLAVFAGLEGSDSGPIAVAVAILPFAALSIIELTKIPLIALMFEVRSIAWKAIACVAILFVVGATTENFVFGFERGFNERIRTVDLAEQAVKISTSALEVAQTRLPQLSARQNEITARLATLRDEAAATRQQAQQDIADTREHNTASNLRSEREGVERDILALDQRREAELNRERARCRATGTSCNITVISNSFSRQRAALSQRSAALAIQQRDQESASGAEVTGARQKRDNELADKERERSVLQLELNTVREQLTEAQTTVLRGSDNVSRAAHHRDEMIEKSQLHRLSMVLFGSHERETLEKTKRLFVVSLAIIVAVVGAIIAALHYAAEATSRRAFAEQARSHHTFINVLRGWRVRHRRRLTVWQALQGIEKDRTGLLRNLRGITARRRQRTENVVYRDREKIVDRLKLVYLPLDASEEEIASIRRNAAKEAA